MAEKKYNKTIIALLALLVWAALPTVSQAAWFAFGGDDKYDVKVQSQGKIDYWWVPITSTSDGGGDPLVGLSLGLFPFHVADYSNHYDNYHLSSGDIYGLPNGPAEVGDSHSGFDWDINNEYGRYDGSNFFITSDTGSKQGPSTSHLPSYWQLGGSFHLTSVTYAAQNQVDITGYVTDLTSKGTVSSQVAKDLLAQGQFNLAFSVIQIDYGSGQFITTLNSQGFRPGPGSPAAEGVAEAAGRPPSRPP